MACSKIFSGDISEISICIIRNLRNNLNTLYSCALLNRFWCRLATPLLWEDPFSIECRENLSCHFLDTYFLFLNNNDKNKIKEIKSYKYDEPLFNYPSLIKTLNLFRLQLHVINWLNYTTSTKLLFSNKNTFPLTMMNHLRSIYAEESVLHREREASEPMQAICVILIKLFIENNASLNNLHIRIYYPYSQNHVFHDIYETILNNLTFISDIKTFTCRFLHSFYSITPNISPNIKPLRKFLSSLKTSFNSINHIDFLNINTEFEKSFSNVIQSQKNLSSIRTKSPKLLNSLKYSSNTLTSINFYSCDFSDNINFDSLSYLIKLESLQFNRCKRLNSNIIQPLINITKPLKIKTFAIFECEIKEIIPLQLLIEKIGSYIEILVLNVSHDKSREKLFNNIIEFCEKIKFLHLGYIDFKNIPQLSKMISNFNNYLKYLTLEMKFYGFKFPPNHIDHKDDLKISSMILKELSNLLPLSLNYLDLNLVIDPNDLKMVFKNRNQVKLKRLLIRNRSNHNLDVTLNIIKDFVKEKNLEFLAYGIGSYAMPCEEEIRHKSLENLVKKVQPFVKMKKYDDLVIRLSEVDGSLIDDEDISV